MTGLTPKQQRFIEEYLTDLNATQAAIRAGYSVKTADVQGPRLLGNVGVQQAITKAQERRAKRTEVNQDRVILELARLGFSKMDDYTEWGPDGVTLKASDELSEDAVRAIVEVSETVTAQGGRTIRFKLHEKKGALDTLAKHLGLLIDRHELTGAGGKPFTVTFADIARELGHDDTDAE